MALPAAEIVKEEIWIPKTTRVSLKAEAEIAR